MSCVFCKIIRGEIPSKRIYEDEKTLAFLDINPSAPGHTLIIPKRHESRVEGLTEGDASALFGALHRLVGPIQNALDADGSTIGINNGSVAGQEVPHAHIHVIPRRMGDRGGIIQGITRRPRPSSSEMDDIARRIRANIENSPAGS